MATHRICGVHAHAVTWTEYVEKSTICQPAVLCPCLAGEREACRVCGQRGGIEARAAQLLAAQVLNSQRGRGGTRAFPRDWERLPGQAQQGEAAGG